LYNWPFFEVTAGNGNSAKKVLEIAVAEFLTDRGPHSRNHLRKFLEKFGKVGTDAVSVVKLTASAGALNLICIGRKSLNIFAALFVIF